MLEKHVLNWNEFDANCRHLDELFDQHSRATVDASQCELKVCDRFLNTRINTQKVNKTKECSGMIFVVIVFVLFFQFSS